MGSKVVLITFAAVAAVFIAVVAVYLVCYKRAVNKRLAGARGKKLWPPLKVCVVAALAALAVFGAVTGFLASRNSSGRLSGALANAVCTAQVYGPQDMETGYLSLYSMDENPGYTKYVKQLGDVRYTVFVSGEAYDGCHPAFLIFAEYTGTGAAAYYDADCSFLTPDGTNLYSASVGGGDTQPYICIVGNSTADCGISCVVDYYNEKKDSVDFDALRSENDALTFSFSDAGAG